MDPVAELDAICAGTENLMSAAAFAQRLRSLQHDHITELEAAMFWTQEMTKALQKRIDQLPAERQDKYTRLHFDALYRVAFTLFALVRMELKNPLSDAV